MTRNFVLSYAGVDIPLITDFESGDPTMINATKMLWCFPEKGRNNGISHFLENQSTKNYINALSCDTGIPVSQLLVARKGNSGGFEQGTWMHEDLAMEFARWLNPSFAIWCNRKIKELLVSGVTTLSNENIQLKQVNSQLQQSNNQLQQDNSQLKDTCDKMRPYADYGYDIMTNSKMTYSTTDLVKGFSCRISVQEVFARLVNEGYIGKYANSKTWFLKAPYDKMGCTRLVSKVVNDKSGKPDHTVNQVRWTEAGRSFLRTVLLGWGVIPATGNP